MTQIRLGIEFHIDNAGASAAAGSENT